MSLTSARKVRSQTLSCSSKTRSGSVSRFAGTLPSCTLKSTTRPRPSRANAAAYFKAARACCVKSVGNKIFRNGNMEVKQESEFRIQEPEEKKIQNLSKRS